MRRVSRVLRIGLAAALAAPVAAGCRQPPDKTVIAVLTPAGGSLATEPGRSTFADRVAGRCAACVVAAHYDEASAASTRAAVADGADVVVVEALTSELGEEVVAAAGPVPVVAVDRFVAGADWFVGYDHQETGAAVADAIAEAVGEGTGVLVVDGSTVDADSDEVEQGLRGGLASRGLDVVDSLAATTGSAEETRDWILGQLGQLDQPAGRKATDIGAVLTATDEQARGVADAFRRADLEEPWPLISGTGGSLEAVRRVVTGEQTLTVHLPVAQTAERAADVALSLVSEARGADLQGGSEVEGVPAYVLAPRVVSADNVTEVVVRDGTFTPEQICSAADAALSRACARLGIR